MSLSNIITILPTAASYSLQDTLRLSVVDTDLSTYNYLEVDFYISEQDSEYDLFFHYGVFDLIPDPRGNYSLAAVTSQFRPGIFFIGHVTAVYKEHFESDAIRLAEFKIESIRSEPFLIFDNKSDKYVDLPQVRLLRDLILNRREHILNSGFGDKNSTTAFRVLVFCTTLHLTRACQYSKYEIIPFLPHDQRYIFNYVNQFLTTKGFSEIAMPEVSIEILSQHKGGAVISFPKVLAENVNHAGDIAEMEVSRLLKTFALTRDCYGSILCSIVQEIDSVGQYIRIFKDLPNGNIIPGVGENPLTNRRIITAMRENQFLNLAATLYMDAQKDDNIEVSYSRLWSILEMFADKKQIRVDNQNRFYLNGQQIPPGNKNKYHSATAKDKVRELIRSYREYSKELLELFPKHTSGPIGTDDLLTIWNRHRNCTVHSGGCFPHDETVCKNSENYLTCRNAHLSITSGHVSRTIYNDLHYGALVRTVRVIIVIEALQSEANGKHFDPEELYMPTMKEVPSNTYTKLA